MISIVDIDVVILRECFNIDTLSGKEGDISLKDVTVDNLYGTCYRITLERTTIHETSNVKEYEKL
jgi:hypothetical protein